MARPSADLVQIARRIVEHEAGGPPDPAASAAAVEQACRRLKQHLVTLLGTRALTALLGRALHLVQRDQPLLADVAVSGEPGAPCFTGLGESLASGTDEQAWNLAAAILAHIIDLLTVLFGEDLGMKPIRKLWPHATNVTETDE